MDLGDHGDCSAVTAWVEECKEKIGASMGDFIRGPEYNEIMKGAFEALVSGGEYIFNTKDVEAAILKYHARKAIEESSAN